jgi:hypothetical protein
MIIIPRMRRTLGTIINLVTQDIQLEEDLMSTCGMSSCVAKKKLICYEGEKRAKEVSSGEDPFSLPSAILRRFLQHSLISWWASPHHPGSVAAGTYLAK